MERRVDRAEFEEQHFAASTLTTVSLPPNDLPNTLRASPQVSGNLHTTLLSIVGDWTQPIVGLGNYNHGMIELTPNMSFHA